MSNELKNIIQQADQYIKQGEYRAAWELLLPYKDQPAARKRLIWLRNQRKEAAEQVQEASSPARRSPILLVFILIIIVALGAFLILGRGDDNNPPDSLAAADLTGTAIAAASSATTGESATDIPELASDVPEPATETPVVTEDPQELTIQEALELWVLDYEGVDNVISLDVDIPEDEPPLVYVELVVFPGNNNTAIPDAFKQHLNDTLSTTDYSDFVVILSDGQQVVEYILNEDGSWQQTPLVSSTPSTPRP